jgi:iron complex transport system ATP-binding protein
MAELIVEGLTLQLADGTRLLDNINFSASGGAVIAIVGPNGAGKSSLLRSLCGLNASHDAIFVDGQRVASLPPIERARKIAWLPQSLSAAWPVGVRDAVALGRFAYGAVPGRLSSGDAEAVDRALHRCDLTAFADRRITTLSGGELARVHMARIVASEADILLADEPVAALDPVHRLAMMDVLGAEAASGRLVLVVLHDITLAARWAHRIIALKSGEIIADGHPQSIITPGFMRDVFAVEAEILDVGGRPCPVTIRAAARVSD